VVLRNLKAPCLLVKFLFGKFAIEDFFFAKINGISHHAFKGTNLIIRRRIEIDVAALFPYGKGGVFSGFHSLR
jgi:hypothetical protein